MLCMTLLSDFLSILSRLILHVHVQYLLHLVKQNQVNAVVSHKTLLHAWPSDYILSAEIQRLTFFAVSLTHSVETLLFKRQRQLCSNFSSFLFVPGATSE